MKHPTANLPEGSKEERRDKLGVTMYLLCIEGFFLIDTNRQTRKGSSFRRTFLISIMICQQSLQKKNNCK